MHIDACRLICGLLAKLALRFDCECGNWQKAFSVTAASSLLDLAINTLKWVSDFWPKTEAPQKKRAISFRLQLPFSAIVSSGVFQSPLFRLNF